MSKTLYYCAKAISIHCNMHNSCSMVELLLCLLKAPKCANTCSMNQQVGNVLYTIHIIVIKTLEMYLDRNG